MSTANDNGQTAASQPPIGIAGIASMICLAFIYAVANPVVNWLAVWWAGLLIYSVIPILVAFTVFYRSSWHREQPKSRRILSLILSACLVFCVSFIAVVLIVALVAMFTGLAEGH
ncbi:MAG: hypothetical protein WCH99_02455 [Verrucomicrobiota bacterium]